MHQMGVGFFWLLSFTLPLFWDNALCLCNRHQELSKGWSSYKKSWSVKGKMQRAAACSTNSAPKIWKSSIRGYKICDWLSFNYMLLHMGSDFDSACCLQDLTELHKERQCLEKRHQQEVNKLNQELQQARTLHNSLQAQADKVNIKVINKTKEKQSFCSSVRNYTYDFGVLPPPPQLCYLLLSVLFLFPLLCFIPRFFCCLYQGSKIFHHLLYDLICSPFHCLALCVFLLCFPPSTLLSASSPYRFLSNGKVKLWR